MKLQPLLLAALMSSVVLAGCVSDDGELPDNPGTVPDGDFGPGYTPQAFDSDGFPVPVLVCREPLDATDDTGKPIAGAEPTRCNFEMTPDEGREGNEVTIAVNPLDPQNIVGGAKDYYEPDAGECVWNGVYVTHDGARTAYEDRSFDGSPWRAADGDPSDFEQNYASTFWCTTDPVAYFDVNGNLYYLLMAYQTDPVTGGKTGEGVEPQGALNDWAFNRAVQIVAKSTDGGDTFDTFTPVMEGTFPITFHDKGWIAASADGTIHVMWWAAYAPGNLYFRSTDGGETFSDPEVLSTTQGARDVCEELRWSECEDAYDTASSNSSDAPAATGDAGQGSFVDVGTGPEVYVLWNDLGLVDDDGVQMRRSFDHGATWDEQRSIFQTNNAAMPTLEGRDRRGGHPQLATDRNPDSPFADSLYVVWQDSCQDDVWSEGCRTTEDNGTLTGSGIWLRASHDKGLTWEEPVRVSDAPAGHHEWRIFPTVSVSPGGVVDVSWMDSTDARWLDCKPDAEVGEPHCPDQYQALGQRFAYSLDGGQTFSANFDVRQDVDDQGWDPALCHHQNGEIFIGDYNDIDSSWQAAHPVWPDSRLGVCDVFTASIQRPMFAEGWSDEQRLMAEDFIRSHPL